jgi:RraA family protein
MAIGFRAFFHIQRPEMKLVEEFRGIPSSNIGDCVKRMNCMFGGIHPFNDKVLLGTAFTVKVPSGDNLAALTALDYAQPGDIIVIDGAGYTDRALVGGMMLAYAEMRGLGGFVVNGAVRDLEDIQNSTLPVFALSATPLGPYREGPGEINVPVVCGGQVVMPGDILVGDVDGIVVIPKNDAENMLEAARNNLAGEQEELRQMKDGTYMVQEHKEHFSQMFLEKGGSFEK